MNNITFLQASDKDTGVNAALSYTIVSGNGAGIFAIHSSRLVIDTPYYGLVSKVTPNV